MQLKKTSKKKWSLINEIKTFSNGYFSFNNIDWKSNLKIYISSNHTNKAY